MHRWSANILKFPSLLRALSRRISSGNSFVGNYRTASRGQLLFRRCRSHVFSYFATLVNEYPSFEDAEAIAARTQTRTSVFVENALGERLHSSLNIEECKTLRQDLITETGRRFERAIDAQILGEAISHSWFSFGLSYINFLVKEKSFNPGSIAVTCDLIFKAKRQHRVDDKLVETIRCLIEGQFAHLKSTLLAFPTFLCLCCSIDWKQAAKYTTTDSKLARLPKTTFSFAATCFRNDEPTMAFDTLERFAKSQTFTFLSTAVNEAAFDYLLRESKKQPAKTIRLLEEFIYLSSKLFNSQGVSPEFAEIICQIFKNVEYKTQECKIENGKCPICSERLENNQLSAEDFRFLQNEILNKVLKGKDVFQQSTPAELNAFRQFVRNYQPFDLVIDGMNLAYRVRTPIPNRLVTNLFDSLNALLKLRRFKNPCIVVKEHVFIKQPEKLEQLRKMAAVFTVKDYTTDDCFVLYAAAASGRDCYVVSQDAYTFLANHLNTETLFLVNQWKRSRFIVAAGPQEQYRYNQPLSFTLKPQFTKHGFHIPMMDGKYNIVKDPHFTECKWLCATRKGTA